MNRLRTFRKNKEVRKKRANRIRSITIKIALLLLNFIFATFAWFIYELTLDTTVDVRVSTWKLDFKENDVSLETDVQFELENFYPGMPDYVKTIEIENLGERAASIDYQVDQLKILGQEYQIKEAYEEGDSEYTVYSEKTTGEGENTVKILNNLDKFPFEIVLTYSQEVDTQTELAPDSNKGVFKICFTWPYEVEGTDEEVERKNNLDTLWGCDIADFYKERKEGEDTHGLEITLQTVAKQIIN